MKILSSILFFLVSAQLLAQQYVEFQSNLLSLYSAASSSESLEQALKVLQEKDQIPIRQNDSVAFLYFGQANSVDWMGDFNGWGYHKSFENGGKKIAGSSLWMLKASFPRDARLDYKIVIDKQSWILDPLNPHQQWSGVGGGSPNSELRMPEYQDDKVQTPRQSITHGRLNQDILYSSKLLGYQLTYSVYSPAVEIDGKLPVVYVTDGYEYLHPQLGNMPTVL
ncbi:MAG TPA: hypothetical protein VIS49_02600, partial [Cyclobacteriaceae bacterium]